MLEKPTTHIREKTHVTKTNMFTQPTHSNCHTIPPPHTHRVALSRLAAAGAPPPSPAPAPLLPTGLSPLTLAAPPFRTPPRARSGFWGSGLSTMRGLPWG